MDQKISSKKPYKTPTVQVCGDLVDLTQTGLTNPGGDAKGGSVLSGGV